MLDFAKLAVGSSFILLAATSCLPPNVEVAAKAATREASVIAETYPSGSILHELAIATTAVAGTVLVLGQLGKKLLEKKGSNGEKTGRDTGIDRSSNTTTKRGDDR